MKRLINYKPGAETSLNTLIILSVLPVITDSEISERSLESREAECSSLAKAINLNVVHTEIARLKNPKVSTLIGAGKLSEIEELIKTYEIKLIIIDNPLTAIQQRNLERKLDTKVIDRTALILEIFSKRARTREGRLQVELASLTYQRSRLVRSWTHLERQRGGFGFVGGPGETQIESDRRQIDERIKRIKKLLLQVVKTRSLHRKSRQRVPYPVVALVGYTNTGKSTLFNKLTGASVISADQLFATLDPTMRTLKLPSGSIVILSDTVGFISKLPHDLVTAFSATLEEVVTADLIIHVRDISHSDSNKQHQDVMRVLNDLNATEHFTTEKIIEVFNKIDCLTPQKKVTLNEKQLNTSSSKELLVSAKTGEGLQKLVDEIQKRLQKSSEIITARAPITNGAAQAWLHQRGEVLNTYNNEEFAWLRVRLPRADVARAKSHKGIKIVAQEYNKT